MIATNVLSSRVTATGVAVPARARVRAINVAPPLAATTVTISDGSTLLLTLDVSPAMLNYFLLPAEGLLCQTNVTVGVGTATAVTVIYS